MIAKHVPPKSWQYLNTNSGRLAVVCCAYSGPGLNQPALRTTLPLQSAALRTGVAVQFAMPGILSARELSFS
jgi:hypothetical protein